MRSSNEHRIVFITCPTEESATNIANILVSEKLAACCNIIDKVRSIYFWDGNVCDDKEFLMIIKTREDVLKQMEKRIVELHDYDVPEIIAVKIDSGSEDYFKWIDNSLDR